MLLINCSNRENNCFKILNDIKMEEDKLLSFSNKNMKFCLGCNKCMNKLNKYCVLDYYITNNLYCELFDSNNIIIASPMYMSNINAITKNLLDRLNPFYHHDLLREKNIYLILVGQSSKEDNEEEINGIVEYFNGISEWLHFSFHFLEYFEGYDNLDDGSYEEKIIDIKEYLEKDFSN